MFRDEPHAVEIAALLGDSVVGMKHCLDPHGGKVSRRTWALVATGASALVAAGVAFTVSVAIAAMNERALSAWHRPRAAFRPAQLSSVWDVVAFGGLAIGIAALGWALVRARDERRSPSYRIGTAPGVDQPCEGAPAPSFALVTPSELGFVFQLAPGIEAELLAHDAAAAVALAGPTVVIPVRARIRARVGRTTFLVASTPRPRCEARARIRLPLMKYFAGSLAAHVAMWWLLCQLPIDDGGGRIELTTEEVMTLRTTEIDHDASPPPFEPSAGTGGGQESGPAAVGMAMPEGDAGSRASTTAPTHLQIAHRADVDRQYSRAEAIEQARQGSIFADSSALEAGIAAITAAEDFANGFEVRDVMGPMYGPDGPVGSGGFGTGRDVLGPGGGGWGTIGSGKYGAICGGSMHDCGGGSGGAESMSGRLGRRLRPHVVIDPVVCAGCGGEIIYDYDTTLIRRYIRRNMEKLTYCYEHALLSHPDLEGSITATFFIQPDGRVSASTAAGFDAAVASCVADVVKSIEFPPPGSSGIQVNYPFQFRRAD